MLSHLYQLSYAPRRAIRNAAAIILLLNSPVLAEPLTVVAFGDSLTQGYGLPAEDGVVPQLQAWLAAAGADVVVVNAGVSGDTTAGGASRIEWTLTPDVDALIVNLGGNDMLRGIDPATSKRNLEAILVAAQAKKLPVLLVSLRAPGNYGADFKADFDAMYGDLAAKYGSILAPNYFIPLIDQSSRLLDPALMQADGIHPNAAGVAKAITVLGPKVQDLLAAAVK